MSDGELAVIEAEAELAKAHARNALAEWALAQMALVSYGESVAVMMQLRCNAACAGQDVIVAEARLKRAKGLLEFYNKTER